MKNKLFFINIILLFFILSIHTKSFALHKNTYVEGSVETCKYYYNDVILNISNNRVKFTQDDEFYYFSIIQFISGSNTLPRCSYHKFYNNISMAVTNFYDIDSVYVKTSYANNTGNYSQNINSSNINNKGIPDSDRLSDGIHYQVYEYSYKSNKVQTNNGNNEIFINSYCAGNATNQQKDFLIIEKYKEENVVNNFDAYIKFKIRKTKIDKYRYFRFLFPMWWDYDTPSTGSSYNYISGTTNYSLDLKNYINCEHEFEYDLENGINDETHVLYCKKCEWQKTENHEFLYEYDGHKENLCKCGKNILVNFTLLQNIKTENSFSASYNSNSIIEKEFDYQNYEGYRLLYYEKIIKKIASQSDLSLDKTNLIEETEVVDEVFYEVGNFSIIYKAIYEANKYYLVFNRENNLNLDLSNIQMNTQICEFDREYNIDENKFVLSGFTFLGWSLNKKSNKVDYNDKNIIKNLSNINNDSINLYPVFSENEYIIRYNTDNYFNKILSKNSMPDQILKYTDYKKLNKNQYVIKGYKFLGWSYRKQNSKNLDESIEVDFKDEDEISKISSKNNDIINLYPIYRPIKYSIKYKITDANFSYINLTDATIHYDEEYKLDRIENLEHGYIFKGYSIDSDDEIIKFNESSIIKNYTDVDDYILNLYPVFSKLEYYYIDYHWNRGSTSGGKTQEDTQEVKFDSDTRLNSFNLELDRSFSFDGWYYNDEKISYSKQLDKYVFADGDRIKVNAKYSQNPNANERSGKDEKVTPKDNSKDEKNKKEVENFNKTEEVKTEENDSQSDLSDETNDTSDNSKNKNDSDKNKSEIDRTKLNIDTDGDGIADENIDIDEDGIADMSINRKYLLSLFVNDNKKYVRLTDVKSLPLKNKLVYSFNGTYEDVEEIDNIESKKVLMNFDDIFKITIFIFIFCLVFCIITKIIRIKNIRRLK